MRMYLNEQAYISSEEIVTCMRYNCNIILRLHVVFCTKLQLTTSTKPVEHSNWETTISVRWSPLSIFNFLVSSQKIRFPSVCKYVEVGLCFHGRTTSFKHSPWIHRLNDVVQNGVHPVPGDILYLSRHFPLKPYPILFAHCTKEYRATKSIN